MNEPHDPNLTADLSSIEADSLDAGLAAGFGRPANGPGSVLSALRPSLGDLRPVLLREAQGESSHIVKPKSDAMPTLEQTGERYQLSGEIARGGMGAVLRGRDVDLGRDLAVKVLLQKYADRPEVARRFIEEAQIGGQLQHPGVVPVYDIGCFGDRPFFTMKMVKGKTLAVILSERTDLTAERPGLLGIALKVTQTIAYAHAKGVIHRDLKPGNIMVGAFGEVQVMDWGLAKVLAEGGIADEERANRQQQQPEDLTTIRTARSSGSAGSGTDTEAGSLLGTPAYMPPEQANGEVALLDRRADVFGLGAILCEILTGKAPYVGRSAEEVRRKAANGDLADALARLDGCGADAELIVLTKACLSPEAIDRPKDAQAVAENLTAYLDGVQQRLHQAELAEAEARAKAVEEAKRRRLTLALAATVLLALTLGGGGWLYVKNERDARQAQVTREVNETLNKVTALREQARTAVVGSGLLFAQAREQAQRALALVESGPVDDTLKMQVRQLQTDLDEEENDRRLVVALDEAWLAQAEQAAGERRFASERAVPKFREALRAYGLPAGEGEPKVAAECIRQRPSVVRQAILAALDEWHSLAGRSELNITEPHREWLRAVLDAAEPAAGWTHQYRAIRDEKDEARRRAALERLAAADDVETLPPQALTRLAEKLDQVQAHASAARLMRRTQRKHPADFWVNYTLGEVLQKVTPPERDEAVRYLTAAVALRPESPGAIIALGNALSQKGQFDEAIAWCNKAIELDPKYVTAHTCLGNALHHKGQLDEAIACHKKALELDPKFAWAHNNLGIALHDKGQLDEAIVCLKKTLELEPKAALAHNNLGRSLAGKGQVDEAIACYNKAIELDPKFAMAHSNLGIALRGKGQLDAAIASYNKAIELDPKFATAHINLGAFFCDVKRDYDAAIACFQKAIELDPNSAIAHNNLGIALKHKGQLDAAIASYNKAIELGPKYAVPHFHLGLALQSKGQVDAAIASYNKAIELDPKDAIAHNDLGRSLAGKGQVDEAIASYNKAIALDPKDAIAHSNLGVALKAKGQLDEAIASYKKAIELDPKHAAAHNNLGAIFCDVKRDYDAAIACFQKAIELEPKYADAHMNLGNALVMKGRLEESIAEHKKAIELDPNKPGIRYNAACAAALAGCGRLKNAKPLDDKERAGWRKQALDWLRADLALRRKQADSGKPTDRVEVARALRLLQNDADQAGIRDAKEVAKLPADERQACEKLWADVAALLKKAGEETK